MVPVAAPPYVDNTPFVNLRFFPFLADFSYFPTMVLTRFFLICFAPDHSKSHLLNLGLIYLLLQIQTFELNKISKDFPKNTAFLLMLRHQANLFCYLYLICFLLLLYLVIFPNPYELACFAIRVEYTNHPNHDFRLYRHNLFLFWYIGLKRPIRTMDKMYYLSANLCPRN